MSQEYNICKHYVHLDCAYYAKFIISSLRILIEKVAQNNLRQDKEIYLNLNINFVWKIFLNFNLFKIKNSKRNKNKL